MLAPYQGAGREAHRVSLADEEFAVMTGGMESSIPSSQGERAMFATRPSKRTMSFTWVGLAVAVIGVMTAIPNAFASDVSYDQMPPSYYALMKMKPAELMRMLDPDKKGYVTKEDFMKFHHKMAENMFEKMDKNHNGKLEQSELNYPSYPLPDTDPELKKNLSQ